MLCYRFSLQHNDNYAFRDCPALTDYQRIHQGLVPDTSGQERAGVRRCERCGEVLEKWMEPLQGLVIKKRKFEISVTYDGILVVSRRFRTVCEANSLVGLAFGQLPDDPNFFAILPSKAVVFDGERARTRFIDQCPLCKKWKSVVGATPVLLKPGTDIGNREFVRTDLEFGSDDGKHWLLLCGGESADALELEKLKGVDLFSVET